MRHIHALCLVMVLPCYSGCVAFLPWIDTTTEAEKSAKSGYRTSVECETCPARGSYSQTALTPSAGTPARGSATGQPKDRLVRKYVAQLNHNKDTVRTGAATSLGVLGRRAHEAVPALVKALRDPSKNVRRAAARALGKIRSPEAVDPLISALSDQDRYVARTAALALRSIGTSKAVQAAGRY